MKKAFFLDRDGVINVDHGYTHHPSQFEFIAGVFEACKAITDNGCSIVVVTNQSGIGRGYYSEEAFHDLTDWMCEQFSAHGIEILDVRYCPHHKVHGLGDYLLDCDCRKPEPGMILEAAIAHNIDLAESVMVGDKDSDMVAGARAGIPYRYRVFNNESAELSEESSHTVTCSNLAEAVTHFFSTQAS